MDVAGMARNGVVAAVIVGVLALGTAWASGLGAASDTVLLDDAVADQGEADPTESDAAPGEPTAAAAPKADPAASEPSGVDSAPAEPAGAPEPAGAAEPAGAPEPDPTPAADPDAESTGSGVATTTGSYTDAPSSTAVWIYRAISLLGIACFVGLGWVLSEKRKFVKWRPVVWGVGLQLLFGLVVLGLGGSEYIYVAVNYLVGALLSFSDAGAAFVFASFIPHQVDTLGPDGFQTVTYGLSRVDTENWSPATRNVGFAVLPTIIFFSALMSLLYYIGVMSPIVKGIAWLMMRTLGTSGSESLSAAGNIFVGQTEAPLLVKPFVPTMTRSELMAIMTGGFATVAGGVLGVYVMLLQDSLPSIAGHLVVASILSAPAALAMAKLMVPETEESDTVGSVKVEFEQPASNFIEAAANGASDGMKLVLNVAAMLIAIVALVAMANWAISWIPVGFCDDWSTRFGYGAQCGVDASGAPVLAKGMDLSVILGVVFFPAAMLMGVPYQDWFIVGQLLGEKIVLTELIAYKSLAALVSGSEAAMTQRSAIIASYALCGFANFASIGIQLGGIGGIAPKRMGELASLGFKAMVAGAIAACMTGAVAGVFL